jgi:large subunit ribosomal protein L25
VHLSTAYFSREKNMAASLTALPREERGKNAMRRLRSQGLVPAVLYGHGDETRTLALRAQELEKLLGSISVENTIIDLAIEGAGPTQTLIREVQHHPSRKAVLHVDFLQIHANEKIHLEVPIRLHGSPIGVRDNGGILQEVLREVHVECLPRDIPEAIDLDIENLDVGDVIHVRDVSAPNVRILNDPDIVLVTVVAPTVAALPEGEEDTGMPTGEGEPEVIRRRESEEGGE